MKKQGKNATGTWKRRGLFSSRDMKRAHRTLRKNGYIRSQQTQFFSAKSIRIQLKTAYILCYRKGLDPFLVQICQSKMRFIFKIQYFTTLHGTTRKERHLGSDSCSKSRSDPDSMFAMPGTEWKKLFEATTLKITVQYTLLDNNPESFILIERYLVLSGTKFMKEKVI